MNGRFVDKLLGRHTGPLLVRARADPELFAEFYASMYEQVLGYFARRTWDPETAFDLMAETFAAAFAGLPQFRGETEEESYAWLWTIARHQLSHWSRRGKVSRQCLERLGVDPPALSDDEFERVEELADVSRLRAELAEALDALNDDQREAVRLRVLEDRSYEEIAGELRITQQVARARVSRGLRTLALALEPVPAAATAGDGR
jgi:RNA polymerase sigma-70 factor (ECF subfamily)